MGFPVELVDGSKVEIVKTEPRDGGGKVLIDALGNKYVPSLSPLKVELVEAAEAIEAGAESVSAELREAATEIGDAIGDAVEEVGAAIEAASADITEEVSEAVDAAEAVVTEAIEAAEELIGDAVETAKDLLPGDEAPSGEEAPPAPEA